MKRSCKLPSKRVSEMSEDIILDILHRLPSKSLLRFKCVCNHWRRCIADPNMVYSCRSQRWRPQPDMIGFFCQARMYNVGKKTKNKCPEIHFFFSSRESSKVIEGSLDKSVDFLGRGMYIVASSNGFLLTVEDLTYQEAYYIYDPATRQHWDVPLISTSYIKYAVVALFCKVDDPEKDLISFTIFRYQILANHLGYFYKIESFSSETNVWTKIVFNDHVLSHYTFTKPTPVRVIDGVFCWFEKPRQIRYYDSVNNLLGVKQLSEEMKYGYGSLGISGGTLYYALYERAGEDIIVWCLESNIRSKDTVWVKKYAANIDNMLLNFPGALDAYDDSYGLIVESMDIHPTIPHIFYITTDDKVYSYDLETNIGGLIYDLKDPSWFDKDYSFFTYEWHQWPRLLYSQKG